MENITKICKNVLRYSPNYSKEIEQVDKEPLG